MLGPYELSLEVCPDLRVSGYVVQQSHAQQCDTNGLVMRDAVETETFRTLKAAGAVCERRRVAQNRTEADVTEGSGGIWERLRYDWSDPNHVVLTTTDSNVWGGASGHTYTFSRQPNGTTDIDLEVVREGKNLKGWMLGLVLKTIGRSALEKAFVNSVKVIEARNVTRGGRAA